MVEGEDEMEKEGPDFERWSKGGKLWQIQAYLNLLDFMSWRFDDSFVKFGHTVDTITEV